MSAVVTKGVLPYDLIANFIIRAILKKRGTKETFSSAEAAERALRSLSAGEQDAYRMRCGLKNRVEEELVSGFPVYTISPKKGDATKKRVLYLHGGAFVNQPDDRHFRLADDLVSRSGAVLVFPVYPKAPSHRFGEAYGMIEGIYDRLTAEVGAENVILSGDSAGAMLCVTLCHFFRSKGKALPSKLILFSPVADTSLSNPEIQKIYPRDPMQGVDGLKKYIEAWAGDESVSSPLIDPAAVDPSILPETTVFCGMNEIFEPDAAAFAERAASAGADVRCFRYRHMYHCFVLFDLISASAVRRMAARSIAG